MSLSRKLAQTAQQRESIASQPKEMVKGDKCLITIRNYLGGLYYLTSDEIEIEADTVYLIEAKHTKSKLFPSIDDIKDGLVKMILFSNLKNVEIDGKGYNYRPVLKLTSTTDFNCELLSVKPRKLHDLLFQEANQNNFELRISQLPVN